MAMAAFPLISLALSLLVLALAAGDTSADRAQCADKLVGLAPCLLYVQGQATAPAPGCCAGLRQVLSGSPKCLCVLIRDRDDPDLGIKLNATIAMGLPAACATKANVSRCPELLNIPPNSKEAAIFEQGGNGTTIVPPVKGNSSEISSGGGASAPTAQKNAAASVFIRGQPHLGIGFMACIALLLLPSFFYL